MLICILSLLLCLSAVCRAQETPSTSPNDAAAPVVPFTAELWELQDATIVEHLGRPSLQGRAHLLDVDFTNGSIGVDIAVDGRRSYPGVIFRIQSDEKYERFYLRPHRAGLYPDALHYTPVFNGVACWQLYHGKGFTAGAEFPIDRWFHVEMQIQGSQARIFLDDDPEPALVIYDLKHGDSQGSIGVLGPTDGSAYFSNFRYAVYDSALYQPPPKPAVYPGTLTGWEISRSFPAGQIRRDEYPNFYRIFGAGWQPAPGEPSGLVNISRLVPRHGRAPDCVLARTVVQSDSRQRVKLNLGYSDEVHLYLNGQPVFWGDSAYRSRDRSFVGFIGTHDAVYLDLEKGLNEIFMMLTESFGGWGLMARTDVPLPLPQVEHGSVQEVWRTEKEFLTPESVLFDPERNVLYVSSFDRFYGRRSEPSGFISILNLEGDILDLHWVDGLTGPCGLALHGDRLYVAERGHLTWIDAGSGEIRQRYELTGTTFLNDVACDPAGRVYISDTFATTPDACASIHMLEDGKISVWLADENISRANGLYVHDGKLLIGNTGDGCLKAVDLADKRVETVISLGAGVVDGIRVDSGGNYLVSLWEGQTFRITPDGQVMEILDTLPAGLNSADFEFISDRNLLIVPTFVGERVVAYSVQPF